MARYQSDWEDLGRSIQDIVDQAVNSRDYRKLNQTVRQVVDKAAGMGADALRRAMDGGAANDTAYMGSSQNLPALYGSPSHITAEAFIKLIGGGLLAGFSGLALLGFAAISWWFYWDIGMIPLLLGLAGMGGGAALMVSGVKRLGLVRRFKTYRRILGEKTHCTLERLARGVGKNIQQVRGEVQKMIDCGLFLQGHLDKEQTLLIVSDEAYQYFEQSRLQLEERQRQEAAAKQAKPAQDSRVQEVLDRGNAFIAQIRACNDAIPGEEISGKIYRMETIVRRIFQRAEQHPEVVPDLKKLMDYYLPMTVKLLNAYADMDAQPVQGENIQASKREIEQTLDTLNLAFEKLLDELFSDTAMDVSSDISVLHTLLAQEGLTDGGIK